MAYDPAELKLPRSLLFLFDFLIRIRLPVWPGWHIGTTRAGALFMAAMLGVWAAALYSGNNLLYLCGAILLSLLAGALWIAVRLLNQVPRLAPFMPEFSEAGTTAILHRELPLRCSGAACVDVSWQGKHPATAVIRYAPERCFLAGRLPAMARGISGYSAQRLETEAPLGMWRLEYDRQDAWQWAVLPVPVAWSGAGLELQCGDETHREGDEWRDLRAYVRGDPMSRVHWRKASHGDWCVKRFGDSCATAQQKLLRVDLRGQAGSAFEQLLGKAFFWMRSCPQGMLMLGCQTFDLSDAAQIGRAMLALAEAVPETVPPAGEGGVLLSMEEHCRAA